MFGCIASMISRRPSVRPGRKAPVRTRVQHTLVRVLFAPKEDEVLERVRKAVIVVRLRCQRREEVRYRTLPTSEHDLKPVFFEAESLNGHALDLELSN